MYKKEKMDTRSKKRKINTETRISQDIIATGQVVQLKRPGIPDYNEPTPSTSGITRTTPTQGVSKIDPTPNNEEKDTEKCQNDNETLTPLCTVCREIPRIQKKNFSVLQCQNGHIICKTCKPKIVTCPICRATDINNRNIFVEQYIRSTLQHKPQKCRHDPCEVHIKMLAGNLARHETFCIHREVNCPNKRCQWHGNLSNLIKHIQEKNCTHIRLDIDHQNRAKQPTSQGSYKYSFQNTILFPNQNPDIFLLIDECTPFKPILLASIGITNLFCYLLIERTTDGNWTFTVYSMLEPEDAKMVTIKLKIGNKETNYSHTTKTISYQHNKQHVKGLGNFMQLNDIQVKRLNNGLQLFDFEIIIEPDPDFLKEANTMANMGRQ